MSNPKFELSFSRLLKSKLKYSSQNWKSESKFKIRVKIENSSQNLKSESKLKIRVFYTEISTEWRFWRLLTWKQNYDIILIKNTVVQGKYEIERVWNNMDRALGRCAPELSNSIFFDKNFCEPNKMPSKLIFDLNWGWTFVRGLYFLILKSKVAIDIPPSLKSIIIPGSTDKPL